MKSRLTKKLLIYFLIILFSFIALSFSLFNIFASRQAIESSKVNLTEKAKQISDIVEKNIDLFQNPSSENGEMNSENMKSMMNSHGRRNGKQNMMSRFQGKQTDFLNSLVSEDVKIIDLENNLLISEDEEVDIDSINLSDDIQSSISEVKLGKEIDTVLGKNEDGEEIMYTLSAVKGLDGNPIAIIYLGKELKSITSVQNNSMIFLLVTSCLALVFVLILARYFAKKFTKPIEEISHTTRELSLGKYDSKVYISQADEIGDLSADINMLSNELQKSKNERDNREQVRRNMISNISHELKTPVTVFKSSIEAILDGIVNTPDEINEYHHILYDETILMEKLIGDLSDLSKLQDQDVKFEKNRMNLMESFNQGLSSQLPISKMLNVNIETDIKLKENIDFIGNETRIKQLFTIIINNALKYTKAEKPIEIKAYEEKKCYAFEFTNYGRFINKENLDKIFVQFYREEDIQNSSVSGSGIGLAIAKEIASKHNINILVESSEQDQRVTFRLEFPRV